MSGLVPDFNRRMDVRQARLEVAVASVVEGQVRSAAEVAELKERLAPMERRLAEDDQT